MIMNRIEIINRFCISGPNKGRVEIGFNRSEMSMGRPAVGPAPALTCPAN